MPFHFRRLVWLVLLAVLAAAWLARGDSVEGSGETLTVGTSGDYAPFSFAPRVDPWAFEGLDVTVARSFAESEGLDLVWERFRWPELSQDVARRRFDVAMSGVTVRPERSVLGRYSVPVAVSGAVVLARPGVADGRLDALDDPAYGIAVNAGGHLERVARARFPKARIVALPRNDAVRQALADGKVDALVTDTREAPRWEPGLGEVERLGPFTRDRKAYLWRADAGARAEVLDAWLLAREADGSLARWREQLLGEPGPPTATPLEAVVAAIHERLALMPLVAEAKRATRRPVRDVPREARVLAAAVEAVTTRAADAGVPAPDPDAVSAFYRAQIEAAVAVQEQVLAGEPDAARPVLDLQLQLRPALLRVGERLAWALVRLDVPPDRLDLRRRMADELAPLGVAPGHARAIADAIVDWARTRATAHGARTRATAHGARTRATAHAPAPRPARRLRAGERPGDQPGQDRQHQGHPVAQRGHARAEDRQLPGERAVHGEQRPAGEERDHRARRRAGAQHHRGDRHGHEGTGRRQRADPGSDQDAAQARVLAQVPAHPLLGNQHLREPRGQEGHHEQRAVAHEQPSAAAEPLEQQVAAALPPRRHGQRDEHPTQHEEDGVDHGTDSRHQ